MLTVTVNAFGSLRMTYLAGAEDVQVELPDYACVSDLCAYLHMPTADVWLTAVNDLALLSDENPVLHDGDLVEFFLPVSGGLDAPFPTSRSTIAATMSRFVRRFTIP